MNKFIPKIITMNPELYFKTELIILEVMTGIWTFMCSS